MSRSILHFLRISFYVINVHIINTCVEMSLFALFMYGPTDVNVLVVINIKCYNLSFPVNVLEVHCVVV